MQDHEIGQPPIPIAEVPPRDVAVHAVELAPACDAPAEDSWCHRVTGGKQRVGLEDEACGGCFVALQGGEVQII